MRKYTFILFSLVLLVALTACDNGKKEASGDQIKNKSVEEISIKVTDASGQSLSFDKVPDSIATLSSGDLDILLSLGANVTGRPTVSGEVAKDLKTISEIGNPHQPNFEKIAEIHPSVLIAGMSFKQHAANIEKQGTKVIFTEANSIDDIQNSIRLYGTLLQKETEAEKVNQRISKRVEGMKAEEASPVKALLVYGAPGTYLAALPNSLSGDLLEKAGGENIAADFPKEDSYPQYASLSVEKIIERNPQVVMLITHGDPNAVKDAFEKEMKKNAAWKNLDAVKNGNVVVLPSNLFGTNPGTKVVEALEVMKESLSKVK
ncbi:ABC transporter substrate-binding protein [Heyndrickxia oleronia]|uniref:ABC transporter substrate-binding protein n=1 Tax=Heyndrickxia oleronia TaxID=38875 RepID=A0AAW6SLJ5_9BACI|nr:ABC transporter substrate-binding protein [Heyndrickxia oleronia]MDH5159610.1 ABC transporter substrate-binding protein [Heyndrickxia oleronia]